MILRPNWIEHKEDMQVQVSGIYIKTGTYTYIHVHSSAAADINPWDSPSSSCITTYTLHTHTHTSLTTSLTLNLCISLWHPPQFLSLLLWISLCLPEISSWPQNIAFCARLLLLTSVHGTTCEKRDQFSVKENMLIRQMFPWCEMLSGLFWTKIKENVCACMHTYFTLTDTYSCTQKHTFV